MKLGLALLFAAAATSHPAPVQLTKAQAVEKVSREKVCLDGLDVQVSENENAWCVTYQPKAVSPEHVLGPEGTICVDKRSGHVDEMIFHASPAPCPPKAESR